MQQLKISDAALAKIVDEAKRSSDGLETGGILLGTETKNRTPVIRHAGGPGPKAHRARHSFLRDLEHAQKTADLAWAKDKSEWIGEWHTHPSGVLSPSDVDLHSYLRHLHDTDLRFEHFIAIIACIDSSARVNIAAWFIGRNCIQLAMLRKLNDHSADGILTSERPCTSVLIRNDYKDLP